MCGLICPRAELFAGSVDRLCVIWRVWISLRGRWLEISAHENWSNRVALRQNCLYSYCDTQDFDQCEDASVITTDCNTKSWLCWDKTQWHVTWAVPQTGACFICWFITPTGSWFRLFYLLFNLFMFGFLDWLCACVRASMYVFMCEVGRR